VNDHQRRRTLRGDRSSHDAEREYAYDRKSHFGRLDVALDAAAVNRWTVIDMKKDWKVVFPFETQ
jgi:hypothetical protein